MRLNIISYKRLMAKFFSMDVPLSLWIP